MSKKAVMSYTKTGEFPFYNGHQQDSCSQYPYYNPLPYRHQPRKILSYFYEERQETLTEIYGRTTK